MCSSDLSGSVDGVVVTMMSAPMVALAASGSARTRMPSFSRSAPAAVCALTASRAQIRASAIGRTNMSASSCSPACTPAPKIAATDESGRDRCFAATAPAAAVRTSVR
ncbi:hypothetical protein X758_01410 [Mesorhizobium sp. LSHC416B00]|nr:hypothetical protein X758_01410 [Mesorhizobium sp. LSHC416B00]